MPTNPPSGRNDILLFMGRCRASRGKHMDAQWNSVDDVLASTSDVLFPAGLGRQPVTVASRASDGDTPLHVVVWRNDVQGARLLLSAGADVNARGDMGYTPLHIAVSQRNVAMAELLLGAKARADLVSEIGDTARDEALRHGGAMADVFAKCDR
jgi:uncharacterized protein